MFKSDTDRFYFLDSGFMPFEVEEFEKADTPINTEEPAIQAMLDSRRQWRDGKLARGWDYDQIEAAVRSYYEVGAERQVFDWLQSAYGFPELASEMQTNPDKYNAALRAMRERDARKTEGQTRDFYGRG